MMFGEGMFNLSLPSVLHRLQWHHYLWDIFWIFLFWECFYLFIYLHALAANERFFFFWFSCHTFMFCRCSACIKGIKGFINVALVLRYVDIFENMFSSGSIKKKEEKRRNECKVKIARMAVSTIYPLLLKLHKQILCTKATSQKNPVSCRRTRKNRKGRVFWKSCVLLMSLDLALRFSSSADQTESCEDRRATFPSLFKDVR